MLNIPSAVIYCIGHYSKTQWLNRKIGCNGHSHDQHAYFNIGFVIKLMILITSPIPYNDKIYKYEFKADVIGDTLSHNRYLSDYIFVFMFARLIFVYQTYTNSSGYRTQFV